MDTNDNDLIVVFEEGEGIPLDSITPSGRILAVTGTDGVGSSNVPVGASLRTRPRVMAWDHGHMVMRAPTPRGPRYSKPLQTA